MAQTKRKTATKTAKKPVAKRSQCHKKCSTRTAKCKGISNRERMHVYIVTAMAMIAGILLCANAAIMMV